MHAGVAAVPVYLQACAACDCRSALQHGRLQECAGACCALVRWCADWHKSQLAVPAAADVLKPARCAQIGYWRYISIYRHLQRNPDNQLYPLFEYFENWCQDENRHGDFFSAILKSQPQVRAA